MEPMDFRFDRVKSSPAVMYGAGTDQSQMQPFPLPGEDNAMRLMEEASRPPKSFEEIDQWQYHIALDKMREHLQNAADTTFPNNSGMRYPAVYVLMVYWEDEDPKLPVSLEVEALAEVFRNDYNFNVELWTIPTVGSHRKLNQRVLDFVDLGGDSKDDLKIVYYGGHGMLAQNRQLSWANRPSPKDSSYSFVKWSGIQCVLEEACSDVLILLDCCAGGAVGSGDGKGVMELIAACGFNAIANPVGRYSFTSLLIKELRILSRYPSFTAGVLYTRVLRRAQNEVPEGREIHKVPVFVPLSQDPQLPRSIQLSPLRLRPPNKIQDPPGNVPPRGMALRTLSGDSVDTQSTDATSSSSSSIFSKGNFSLNSASTSMESLIPDALHFPRILLSIRLEEKLGDVDIINDLLGRWIQMRPHLAENIKIEAGFGSFSSLIMVSVPIGLWCYIPSDPAITALGMIKTSNLVPNSIESTPKLPRTIYTSQATQTESETSSEIPEIIKQAPSPEALDTQGLFIAPFPSLQTPLIYSMDMSDTALSTVEEEVTEQDEFSEPSRNTEPKQEPAANIPLPRFVSELLSIQKLAQKVSSLEVPPTPTSPIPSHHRNSLSAPSGQSSINRQRSFRTSSRVNVQHERGTSINAPLSRAVSIRSTASTTSIDSGYVSMGGMSRTNTMYIPSPISRTPSVRSVLSSSPGELGNDNKNLVMNWVDRNLNTASNYHVPSDSKRRKNRAERHDYKSRFYEAWNQGKGKDKEQDFRLEEEDEEEDEEIYLEPRRYYFNAGYTLSNNEEELKDSSSKQEPFVPDPLGYISVRDYENILETWRKETEEWLFKGNHGDGESDVEDGISF